MAENSQMARSARIFACSARDPQKNNAIPSAIPPCPNVPIFVQIASSLLPIHSVTPERRLSPYEGWIC